MAHAKAITGMELVLAVAGLALLWFGSLSGMYLFGVFGVEYHYTRNPVLVSAFLTVWVALLLAFFPRTVRRVHVSEILDSLALLVAFFGVLALFYGLLLPSLTPPIELVQRFPEASLFNAGATYIIPKALELILQQGIVVALILLLASYFRSFKDVVMMYAFLFTVAHIALVVFWPENAIYLIYTLAAFCSALFFPYLVLEVKNGFVYSYIIHWLFYMGLTLWFWL